MLSNWVNEDLQGWGWDFTPSESFTAKFVRADGTPTIDLLSIASIGEDRIAVEIDLGDSVQYVVYERTGDPAFYPTAQQVVAQIEELGFQEWILGENGFTFLEETISTPFGLVTNGVSQEGLVTLDQNDTGFQGSDQNDYIMPGPVLAVSMFGNGGDDILNGGDLSDTIDGGSGADTILGQGGADTLNGGAEQDFISGGDGNDQIDGGTDSDELHGDEGADHIHGGEGSDLIFGGAGGDHLFGDEGDDFIIGGKGDDSLTLGSGADVIIHHAGDGADTVTDFNIYQDVLVMDGQLIDPANPGTGITVTQVGDDVVITGALPGDSITFLGVDLAAWIAANTTTVDGTSGSNVIDLAYTDADGDVIDDSGQMIFGYESNDTIYAGAGDDTISGGDGTDKMHGSLGADHFDGGDGNDFVIYDTSTAGITIDMLNSANSTGEAAGDTYESVEKLQGSSFDDIIFLADGVYGWGLDGNDTIHDGGARESLYGGNGQDVFVFGAGDGERDQINDFTRGDDLIDLSAWGVSDFSQLTITTQTTNDPNEVHVTITFGGESIRLFKFDASEVANLSAADFVLAAAPATAPDLYGTASADVIDSSFVDANGNTLSPLGQVIYAGAGHDVIKDSDGDDTVYGEDGRDTFYAGDGADFYDGGADKDTVRYREVGSGLTIDMNNSANSTGVAAGDTFANIEKIQGTNYDDVIFLAAGVNGEGWGGNDVIYDSTGAESMNGGAGADTFVFVAGDGFRDQITGFEEGIDLIDISAWGASEFGDLTITTRALSNGTQADVDISFNGDTLRLHKLSLADVANIDAGEFIFV